MKKLIALFLTILLCASITPFALAAESPEKNTQMEVSSESLIETSEFNALTPQEIMDSTTVSLTRVDPEIATYADEIEIYIATDPATGKRYARRWNATRGYWVDPYWILIS